MYALNVCFYLIPVIHPILVSPFDFLLEAQVSHDELKPL